jgi:glycosyltransferase involved in cell wall biosynthesis
MKSFVFLVPKTPEKYLTPLRKELWDLTLLSLKSQKYSDWECLVIGETESKDGNITFVSHKAETKRDKLLAALEILNAAPVKPKFIIRFDDDDLISPFALERASKLDFDCYADKFQVHYDITTGKTCSCDYTWLANTVIHKYEHAVSTNTLNGDVLFTGDHSKLFGEYYKNKKVVYTEKDLPLYMRILSPSCLSISNIYKGDVNAYDMVKYDQFIRSVANWRRTTRWKRKDYSEFQIFKSRLEEITKQFYPLIKSRKTLFERIFRF